MIPFSRVYRRGITIGISDTLAYRGSFFVQILFQLFPLVTALFLWRAVFRSAAPGLMPGGYTPNAMLSYYLLMNLTRLATFLEDIQWMLPQQIRKGDLNKYLVRPVDFVLMEWHMRMGGVLMQLVLLALPAGLVYFAARDIMVVPAEGWRWAAFTVSMVLGIQISFLVSLCVAFLAFWLLDITSLLYAIFPLQILLAGGFFPLELLPQPVFAVLNRLPWAYESYLAMRIYLGRVDFDGAIEGLIGQVVWIGLLAGLSALLWKRGLRKYTAVGG